MQWEWWYIDMSVVSGVVEKVEHSEDKTETTADKDRR